MSKIKLSMTTIAKNEERVIGRCIDSVKDIVDEFVIVDTGSEDNTVKIIEEKTGKCYHTEWEGDYAKARNYGVRRCTGDWILVQDCDEHMHPETAKNLKKILEETPENIWEILVRVEDYTDPSMIPTYIVYGHRLFRNNKGILWGGKGHEALTTPLKYRTQDQRIIIKHDKTPNAVSPIAAKPNELAQVFVENFLEAITKNPNDVRSMFYLANTYMGRGKLKKAVEWYNTYLKISGWNDERYQARYYCARCYMFMGEMTKAREMMLDAYEERDDRNEGEIVLGEIAFRENKYNQALVWFHLAAKKMEHAKEHGLPETLLFLEGKAYTYEPYDWLAIVYYKIGDKKNAKKYTLKALEILPDDERLKGNLRFYEE
jgi:glycosyltransferase involved in cell wall biosynthesis